jgi:hypothetical protein
MPQRRERRPAFGLMWLIWGRRRGNVWHSFDVTRGRREWSAPLGPEAETRDALQLHRFDAVVKSERGAVATGLLWLPAERCLKAALLGQGGLGAKRTGWLF